MGTVSSIKRKSIWIGYDPRETAAFAIASYTIRRFDRYTPIRGVVLSELQKSRLYTRETRKRMNGDGRFELVDVPSIAPDYDGRISTEHANARFFVPMLAQAGWALFCDCDVMFLDNVDKLFALGDPSKAIQVVRHNYEPAEAVKMDGQKQTKYPWKNSSSLMLINCDHPAHKGLTLDILNTLPGRDLHRFCWLEDDEIGELPPEWNYLVGVSKLPEGVTPKMVHFTRGLPEMAGWENQEYAEEWRRLRPYAVGAL